MNTLYSKTIDDTTYHFVTNMVKGDLIHLYDVYIDVATKYPANACTGITCEDCMLYSDNGICADLSDLQEEGIIAEHFPDFITQHPELFL